VEYRKLSELKQLAKNPRVIRDHQFQILCESIRVNREYFEARPLILSNRTGELIIIAGNKRYEAAKYLKLRKVPTHLITGMTEEKEREITVRDNINNGEFDWEAIAKEWADLPLADWGMEIPGQETSGAGEGGQAVSVTEVDVSEVADRFWMSVIGPLPKQRHALEKLVAALKSLDGVEVQVGTTEVAAGEPQSWTS